jgi:hypothetical protein
MNPRALFPITLESDANSDIPKISLKKEEHLEINIASSKGEEGPRGFIVIEIDSVGKIHIKTDNNALFSENSPIKPDGKS